MCPLARSQLLTFGGNSMSLPEAGLGRVVAEALVAVEILSFLQIFTPSPGGADRSRIGYSQC